MRLEGRYRIRRIGNQNIKTVRTDIFIHIIFQAIAEDNIAITGTVHEQRNLGHSGQTIIFFYAV